MLPAPFSYRQDYLQVDPVEQSLDERPPVVSFGAGIVAVPAVHDWRNSKKPRASKRRSAPWSRGLGNDVHQFDMIELILVPY